MRPRRTNHYESPPGWTPGLEALARAQLFEAFFKLTEVEHLPVVMAATMLGLCPSSVSGRTSMFWRYQKFGLAGITPTNRSPRRSRIALAARPLIEGYDFVYQGKVIACSVAGLSTKDAA